MAIVADLHIHSSYSRATSRDIHPEILYQWAQRKGIHLLATGDCTHPQWLAELVEKLEPTEGGLWKLRTDLAREVEHLIPPPCRDVVRFVFQTEISTIYKKDGQTRKVHHLVLLPNPSSVRRLNIRLSRIGNLSSDGRPILGLDSRDLLETVLEVCDEALFIPAHVWTPWFSVFGSKSGFNAIEACYGDMSQHITALETGLSSDPAMNWRWSSLDRFQLVSNSDAHSPSRLGREANLLEIPLTYAALREALSTGNGLLGTIEFFPEEGKYHLDGHRKCNVRLEPMKTRTLQGLCPVCNRSVTVGVLHRVVELGDRHGEVTPRQARSFVRLLPLVEILGEILNCGPATQRVRRLQQQLLERWGPEVRILKDVPIECIEEAQVPLLAEAIKRMREGRVLLEAGFDGQYGKINLFREEERAYLQGQRRLLSASAEPRESSSVSKQKKTNEPIQSLPWNAEGESFHTSSTRKSNHLGNLNYLQREAILHDNSPLLIIAGPGTGKTLTLTHRIAHFLREGRAKPQEVLAVTFTNRAAREMKGRLLHLLEGKPWVQRIQAQTLHAFGHQLLKKYREALGWGIMPFLVSEPFRMRILLEALQAECPGIRTRSLTSLMEKISMWRQMSPGNNHSDSLITQAGEAYERRLRRIGALDFDDLLLLPLRLLELREDVRMEIQKEIKFIFVDEYQDLNALQTRLIKQLFHPEGHLTVIGDPDQSIYGFRGAKVDHFADFKNDFPGAKIHRLEENYRSTLTIVRAATQVISGNPLPYPRKLASLRELGLPIDCRTFDTEKAEAIFIAQEINRLLGGTSHWAMHRGQTDASEASMDISFGDVAVLYRLHALSGPLEYALAREGIPFQSLGDRPLRNHEALEGLLVSLSFLIDPSRDDDLLRMLAIPSTGLSAESIQRLRVMAEATPGELWNGLIRSQAIKGLDPGEATRLQRQVQTLANLLEEAFVAKTGQVVRRLISCLRIRISESSPSWDPHAEILRGFSALAEDWEGDLASFLDFWNINRELDLYDVRSDRVSLLSVHAAKGLEFPVVFIAGCEEGLFPHCPPGAPVDLEEERRLFFVAITRAKDRLYLTRARSRRMWGQTRRHEPSRFLSGISESLTQVVETGIPQSSRRKGRQLKLF